MTLEQFLLEKIQRHEDLTSLEMEVYGRIWALKSKYRGYNEQLKKLLDLRTKDEEYLNEKIGLKEWNERYDLLIKAMSNLEIEYPDVEFDPYSKIANYYNLRKGGK